MASGSEPERTARVACALAFLLGLAPIWLTRHEFWDGAISAYAIVNGDLSGAQHHFPELNWFLSHFFVVAAERLYHWADLPGWLSIKGWLTFTLVMLALETRKLAIRLWGVGEAGGWWVAAWVFAFPAWYAYFSYTPMIGHTTAAWLVLLGHRWVHHEGGGWRRWAGWPVLVVSFQLNSALAFVIGLEAAHWLVRGRNERWNRSRSAGLVLLAVATYAGTRLAFPPRGLNAGYNSVLAPWSPASWSVFLRYGAGFATWLLLLAPPVLAALWAARRGLFPAQAGARLLALAMLFGAAAVPYIAVGKGHALFVPGGDAASASVGVALARSVEDGRWFYPFVSLWSARHLLLFTVPSAIAAVWLARWARPRAATAVLALGLVHQLAWVWDGHHERLQRAAQAVSLKAALAALPKPPGGLVDIELPARAGYAIQLHETNYLLYEAWGSAEWIGVAYPPVAQARQAVTAERDALLALNPEARRSVRLMAVMREYQGPRCSTRLRAEFPAFSTADLFWNNLFAPQRLPAARVTLLSQTCGSAG